MECEECGREIPPNSQFCPHCGADAPRAEQPSEPAPAPTPPPAPAVPTPPPPAASTPPPSTPAAASPLSQQAAQAPRPSAALAPGADPASGALVLDFAHLLGAARLILTDIGNFVGLGVALQVGMGVITALTMLVAVLLAIAFPPAGILVGAAAMVILLPALPFSLYAVLVQKLRAGSFDWSMWGRGFSRYFAVLGRMIGLQVVALAPLLVYLLVAGGNVLGLLAMLVRASRDTAPGLAGGLGLAVLAPLGLAVFLVQIWWLARLIFSSGLVLMQDKTIAEAVGQSFAATNRMQWQVLLYGLAMAGVLFGVQIVMGLLDSIPVIGYVLSLVHLVVGGLVVVWQWLVIWMIFRDNYGLAEARGLEE